MMRSYSNWNHMMVKHLWQTNHREEKMHLYKTWVKTDGQMFEESGLQGV